MAAISPTSPSLLSEASQRPGLQATLKAVQFAAIDENAFRDYIRETERDELFKQLAYAEDPGERVIRFCPFSHTGLAMPRAGSEVSVLRDRSQPGVELLLEKKPEIAGLIRKVGYEAFCGHFLHNAGPLNFAFVAGHCGLSPDELRRLFDWINEFFIECHFAEPSALAEEAAYVKVAAFEKEQEGWSVHYYSPLMARGRYVVDLDRLKRLKESGRIQAGSQRLRGLLGRLRLINERKTTLDLILQWFAVRQRAYLESGEWAALRPLREKEVAEQVGRNPATVCRALQSRSVALPWGREMPLRDLFVTPKQLLKRRWKQELGPSRLSDEAMRKVLRDRFGVRLSRRSVAAYRREMGLPSSRKSPAR